jgi:uncharacterized protein (DUF342 family)
VDKLRFKGTVSVTFDPAKVEARLKLSRTGETVYEEAALMQLLTDAGVVADAEEVADAVSAFQKSRASEEEVVVARGVPPIPGTFEVWDWEEFEDLPDELKAVMPDVLHAAGPPDVFRVRMDKSGPQPKEIRERVLVDPNPGSVVWVMAGERVAKIVPPKVGQPGKNIFGQPIPAPVSRAGLIFAGRGLVKRGADVVADLTGFLRRGRDWADVVAHRAERWEVTYPDDYSNAYLSFNLHGGPLGASAVVDKLRADGLAAALIPDVAAVQALIDAAVASAVPLDKVPLVSDRAGSYAIRYNADRSTVFLDVRKPWGRGAPVSVTELVSAVKAAGFKGLAVDAVEKTVQKFLSSGDVELRDFVLAKGTPPVAGGAQELIFTVDFLPETELKTLRESLAGPLGGDAIPNKDKLPAEAIQKAAPVRGGQEFAHLETARGSEGRDGVDVTGKPIPAPAGSSPPMILLSNVKREGLTLVAAIDGMLEVGGDGALRVRPLSDAVVVVTRSADNFEAVVTMVQGRGTGRRLEKAMLDAALAAAQVRFGIDETKLAQAWADAQAGKPVESVLIASGIPSANDVARRLSFAQSARTDAEGRRRLLVRAGEEVATYWQPAEGEVDGRDVLGNLIPSTEDEVRSLVVSADLSVASDDAGRLKLTALKSGELIFDGESVSIVTQIAVAAVGGKAGNVKFPGEVLVAGPVETGAYVMAGNLKVQGRVGGALLSSDKNLQVAAGIHGEGKAVLRAKNHISVGFVERALVMAVGDVHVGKTALGCTFRVNGKIIQKTPEGGVQGGSARVRLGLDVMNLGSPSGHPTAVSFGQDYLVEDQINAEAKETDKLREAIVKLDAFMRGLTGPSDREKLNSARQKKVLMMKMLDKRNLKLINLRDKFDLHVPSEIVVHENLFPGVSIESHGRVYEVKSKLNAVKILFSEQTGRIEVFPLK